MFEAFKRSAIELATACSPELRANDWSSTFFFLHLVSWSKNMIIDKLVAESHTCSHTMNSDNEIVILQWKLA